MSLRRYLVTGGFGFLGAATVRALLQLGHLVRVLDNASRGTLHRLPVSHPGLEVVQGDVRDPRAVRDAARAVDSIVHLAFVNGTRHFYERPELVLDVGVKGIVNVLDACRAEGISELMLASSSEVYQTPPRVPTDEGVPLSIPDPLNPRYSYGGAKIISELIALNYGRTGFERVVVVRPHNVYGPDMGWDHVIPQFVQRLAGAKREKGEVVTLPIQGDGRQTRSFIFVDDFVQGLLTVLEKGRHLTIYNIGTMDEISIAALAEQVAAHLGVGVRIEPGPRAPGGTWRRCPDTTRLTSLGFRPGVSLDQGLGRTVPWYAERAARPPASTRTEEVF